MINQFLKLGMLVVVGRFLKPRLRGLLALLAVWFMITWLHGEYIDYVNLSGDTGFLIQAALIKLVAYVLAFLAYFLLVERRLLLKPRTPKRVPGDDTNVPPALPPARPEGDDGFDFLRHKRRLEGSSDKLLSNQSNPRKP